MGENVLLSGTQYYMVVHFLRYQTAEVKGLPANANVLATERVLPTLYITCAKPFNVDSGSCMSFSRTKEIAKIVMTMITHSTRGACMTIAQTYTDSKVTHLLLA